MHSKGSRLSLRFFVLPATPLPFFRNSILVIHKRDSCCVILIKVSLKRKGSYGLFICLLSPLFLTEKYINACEGTHVL